MPAAILKETTTFGGVSPDEAFRDIEDDNRRMSATTTGRRVRSGIKR
jgi:hypothetical protein